MLNHIPWIKVIMLGPIPIVIKIDEIPIKADFHLAIGAAADISLQSNVMAVICKGFWFGNLTRAPAEWPIDDTDAITEVRQDAHMDHKNTFNTLWHSLCLYLTVGGRQPVPN